MSLVDMQPSELMRLTVRPAAADRERPATLGSMMASVVRTHSMVAMPGASMPTPLIIPPIVQVPSAPATVTASSLETVSVVMIAAAAS